MKNAVKGSRITFNVDVDGSKVVHVGTVCGFERVGGKGNRAIAYRISENADALVLKRDVVSVTSPDQLKAGVVDALLDDWVLENLEKSAKAVERHNEANSPYLKKNVDRKIEKYGDVVV